MVWVVGDKAGEEERSWSWKEFACYAVGFTKVELRSSRSSYSGRLFHGHTSSFQLTLYFVETSKFAVELIIEY